MSVRDSEGGARCKFRSRTRKRRFSLAITILLFLGMLAYSMLGRIDKIWWSLHAERIPIAYPLNGERVTGTILRGSYRGGQLHVLTAWYDEGGGLAIRAEISTTKFGRCTVWRPAGALWYQFEAPKTWGFTPALEWKAGRNQAPPWRWGVQDQDQPTAPWVRRQESSGEWYKVELARENNR